MRRNVLLAGAMSAAMLMTQSANALSLGGLFGSGGSGGGGKCTSGADSAGNIVWNDPPAAMGGGITSTIGGALSSASDMLSDAIGSVGSFLGLTDGSGCASEKTVLVQVIQQARQLYEDIRQSEYQARMLARVVEDPSRILDASTLRVMRQLGVYDSSIYELGSAARTIERIYQYGAPDPGRALADAERIAKVLTEHTNKATMEAADAKAAAKASLDEALAQAGDVMRLNDGVDGQTQAIQVNTQLQRVALAAQAAQFADRTAQEAATLRVMEEMRAQNIIADQKLDIFYGPATAGGAGVSRDSLF